MIKKFYFIYLIGILSIAVLITGIALVLAQVFQNALNSRIKREIVLRNGTDAFEAWQNPPPPVYMQFYFFNLTNPAEVLQGESPAVEQIGPYTYREFRPMENVHFLENSTKISALNPKTYVFVPEMSEGHREDDPIRTANIPALTVMEKFKTSSLISNIISSYMKSKNIGLFTTRTVHELLWGYIDDLLSVIHKLRPEVEESFGLFYKKNATADGEYVILSGEENYKDFARIVEWNGQSSLQWWSTETCNAINGTNAASFHPLITKNETLQIFASDICRSLYVTFEKEVYIKDLPALRFVVPKEVFANSTENEGFCVPPGNCLPAGLLNVSVCKQDAPIIVSSPHFYQAEEQFVHDIHGMKPNKEEHETFMDINPLTGILLRAAKRIQVNVFVEKIDVFSQTGNVKTVVLPVMYLNESVLIDDGSAGKVGSVLQQASVVINIPFIIIALGILLGIVFLVLLCKCRVSESSAAERQPLLQPS
uniref:Scavenger receptor class B member 2 n=1 Tax=Lepisosteus oculatus TaxID=7918 RepID=W5M8G7_LEPOC|nr:PREDICTED: lysosome membrane protein 2 [Lepisosteus oculatus]